MQIEECTARNAKHEVVVIAKGKEGLRRVGEFH